MSILQRSSCAAREMFLKDIEPSCIRISTATGREAESAAHPEGNPWVSSTRKTTSQSPKRTSAIEIGRIDNGAAPPQPAPTARSVQKNVRRRKGRQPVENCQHEYGDANKWRRIYEANKAHIKDPDLIYPGQQLKIPAA